MDINNAREGSNLIKFENVGLRYGLGKEVLSDISFNIAQNSFQFLTGPSGAGKTSLLRLMLLSLRPTRGLVHVFGKEATSIKPHQMPIVRRKIGVVFQDFRLLNHLTTFENVALPLQVRGKHEADYRQDVTDLLDWVGLGERMHVLPLVLSGGEKQRAAIARALIDQPDILLADEPTGNVDPPMAARLLRLFVELHRSGTSVVIATHDLGLMDQFDARRLVLNSGRLQIYEYPRSTAIIWKRCRSIQIRCVEQVIPTSSQQKYRAFLQQRKKHCSKRDHCRFCAYVCYFHHGVPGMSHFRCRIVG